jgi:glutathione synthase/RimK-type ligase-like ATP-grasp enzyme
VLTIAFLTSEELKDLTDDDRLAIAPLAARGIDVVPAVWTRDPDWFSFDMTIIRSPWDWQDHEARFGALLERFATAPYRVENRSAIRWHDKRYLLDLEERGVRIIPTRVANTREKALEIVAQCNYARAIVKPSLAAGGHRMAKIDEARRTIDFDAGGGAYLVQPFVDEVEAEGEWSLVFFEGVYSHAVRKRAKPGEYRIHIEHGGTVEHVEAPREIIADAERAIAAAGETFLFARVDGIVSPTLGGFALTELEVVEPELFLRADPAAPDRFVEAIAKRLAAV